MSKLVSVGGEYIAAYLIISVSKPFFWSVNQGWAYDVTYQKGDKVADLSVHLNKIFIDTEAKAIEKVKNFVDHVNSYL